MSYILLVFDLYVLAFVLWGIIFAISSFWIDRDVLTGNRGSH